MFHASNALVRDCGLIDNIGATMGCGGSRRESCEEWLIHTFTRGQPHHGAVENMGGWQHTCGRAVSFRELSLIKLNLFTPLLPLGPSNESLASSSSGNIQWQIPLILFARS
jgi:hypothetical protein